MEQLEKRLKDLIIARYGNMQTFCKQIDMSWSTLDSILKRGILNSNISNVLRVTAELDIDTESLADGIIEPAHVQRSFSFSPQEKEIILAYRRADDLDRALVLRALGLDAEKLSSAV